MLQNQSVQWVSPPHHSDWQKTLMMMVISLMIQGNVDVLDYLVMGKHTTMILFAYHRNLRLISKYNDPFSFQIQLLMLVWLQRAFSLHTPNFYPCLSDYMQNQFSEAKAMLPSSTNHVSTTSSLKQGPSRLHAEEGGTNHEHSIPVFDKYPESGTRSSHKDPHIAIHTSGQLNLLVCALFLHSQIYVIVC
jgi:hypothetical protein